ncbi:MAG: hypothetical protein HY902_07590, partial [Deltaproteobacteria bacterium]|nr:hypothetical protein [Deltaproteobacteria bacterium]
MADAPKQPGLHSQFRLILALLLAATAAACTDWDAKGGANAYVQTTGPAGYAADASGQSDGALLHWDTWQAPPVDAVASADAATADTEPTYDWDALPADASAGTADAGPADVPQVYSFDGKGDFVGWPDIPPPPPDVPLDAQDSAEDAADGGVDDGGDDGTDLDAVEPVDAAPSDNSPWDDTGVPADAFPPDASACPGGFGCPCTAGADCDSALCVNLGGSSLQCTSQCTSACPAGLACTVIVFPGGDWILGCLLPEPDAGPADTAPDATVDDTADASTDPQDQAGDSATDDVPPNDRGGGDTPDEMGDSSTDLPDVAGDSVPGDALADTVGDSIADSSAQDQNAGEVTLLPDGAAAPDWQGYGDLVWPADADVYAGAIGSCLSMYLYQNESCGDTHPSAACIDSILVDGSLYAQAMFDPLRQCEKAACVDQCASATDKTCMEQCITKYCAPQFFACTSNAMAGNGT